MTKRHMLCVLFLVTALSAALAAQTVQPNAKAAEPKQTVEQPKPSLGVALSLPGGQTIAYPIQPAGTREETLTPIPIAGYSNVSAIRIFPHRSAEKIAVQVTAILTPDKVQSSKSAAAQRSVGDYVIGTLGDSLKLNDLTKLGLPALEVKVVRAPFALDAPDDPCCETVDGLICCAPRFTTLCAECGQACQLGCFAPSRKNPKIDVGLDAKTKARNGTN